MKQLLPRLLWPCVCFFFAFSFWNYFTLRSFPSSWFAVMAEEAALHEKGGEGLLSTPVSDPGSDGLLPVPPQFSVSTVIVTNISPLATEQDLRDFFANCGNIVQINLLGYICSSHQSLLLSFRLLFHARFFTWGDLVSLLAQSQGRPRHLSIRLRAIRDHGAGQRCLDSVYRCSCRHASQDRHGCERHTRWRSGGCSDGGTPYSPGAHAWSRGSFGARAPGCHSALACAAIGFPGQRAELSRKAGRDRTHDLRGQCQLDGTSLLTLSLFLSSSFFAFSSSDSLTSVINTSRPITLLSFSFFSLHSFKGDKLATPSSSGTWSESFQTNSRARYSTTRYIDQFSLARIPSLSLSLSLPPPPLLLYKTCSMAYNLRLRSR